MSLLKASMVLSCVVVIAGCASTKQAPGLSYQGCNYPDSPSDQAPGWICSEPVNGIQLQAVGYSKKLSSGPGMMTDVAATEARSRLSNEFSTEVNSRLSRLTKDTNSSEGNTNRDVVERVQNTLTTMTLSQSRIYKTQISPAGNMYVLVGLSKSAYDDNIDKLVKSSVNNDSPELYRKFLLDQSNKSLDEIRKELN